VAVGRRRPTAVGGEELGRLRVDWVRQADIEERHGVPLALASADGYEVPEVVSFVVHLVHYDADDPPRERENGCVVKDLPERAELLVGPVGVDDHFLDEVIDGVTHRVHLRWSVCSSLFGVGRAGVGWRRAG
jgi:hypothetical protein